MSLNILDHLALAYQPVWGPQRQLAAVRLRVCALHPESVDASHLLHLLAEERQPHTPVLLVSFVDRALLLQALEMSPQEGVWIELPDEGEFVTEDLRQRTALARHMGHQLVQCAPLARVRERALAAQGQVAPGMHLLHLWPEEVALALRAATDRGQGGQGLLRRTESPILSGQIYQNIGSGVLAAHCLDDRRAWGICDWPADDVLHQHRHQSIACDRSAVLRTLRALEQDLSMEEVEDRLHLDPVLTYRMLRMVNSVGVGVSREVSSIRHALMLLGMTNVRQWLNEQLAVASTEAALKPVRQAMVLRAQLMEYLMDAGLEHELRAEIYTTGLFSRIDGLLQEPLPEVLERIPLSGRINDALLNHHGPYVSYLDVACHMEDPAAMADLPLICHTHDFRLDDVNRALIRMLCHVRHNPV
ncbi:HDOD domain-containing protein [Hydrogenophaga sp. OTU3427]|uniref:HDOD domain-containing protein n=1 Tax=Hydrogenophaga sp. OTU3427 TaxID=3043856 RepID=UPI00313CDB00